MGERGVAVGDKIGVLLFYSDTAGVKVFVKILDSKWHDFYLA